MERKFLVLIRRYRLRKEQYLYFSTFFGCSFLRLSDETRRFQFGCAGAQHICIVLALPAQSRKIPAVLGDIIKRRGLLLENGIKPNFC